MVDRWSDIDQGILFFREENKGGGKKKGEKKKKKKIQKQDARIAFN